MTVYQQNLIIASILWGALIYWWFPFDMMGQGWRAVSVWIAAILGSFLLLNFAVGFIRGLIQPKAKV